MKKAGAGDEIGSWYGIVDSVLSLGAEPTDSNFISVMTFGQGSIYQPNPPCHNDKHQRMPFKIPLCTLCFRL